MKVTRGLNISPMRMPETIEVAQPEEENILRTPYSSLTVFKERLKNIWEGTFYL